jgi:preprotein translocase subunit SecF
VLFVGMLSGTYSSIFIATPVLADLKERSADYKQLARQLTQRASSQKRQAKVPVASAAGAAVATADRPRASDATSGGNQAGQADQADQADQGDQADLTDSPDDVIGHQTASVSAGRPSGSGTGGPRAAPGPRQQPRRSSASQRRPSGKKKRR